MIQKTLAWKKVGSFYVSIIILDDPENFSMGLLGKKLVLFMCLIAGGEWCQTLHAVDICDVRFVEDKCVIPIFEKLKQAKPGTHMKLMEFKNQEHT